MQKLKPLQNAQFGYINKVCMYVRMYIQSTEYVDLPIPKTLDIC